MEIVLPELPFAYDALAPHISADTLFYHHDKHHAAYVAKLRDLVAGTDLEGQSLEEIILESARKPSQSSVFNNAAQIWNHSFYWQSLKPNGGGAPSGELRERIARSFGSYDYFYAEFLKQAMAHFGSGWAWLVLENNELRIITTADAMLPMVRGQHALMTCDLWEHAYYLDHQNRRVDYVEAFLKNLVNWDFAMRNLKIGYEQLVVA